MDETEQLIECPFCHENDFDLIGLKYHLQSGHCDVYNEVEMTNNKFIEMLQSGKNPLDSSS